MRLRLNASFKLLGYLFNVSKQTVSKIVYKCLNVLYLFLKNFIIWPQREDIIETMPLSFKNAFGNKVSVIIDCFEIKIQKSSNLMAQAATWSSYKHANTVKILIGICPQGAITYISKTYGGRNSDKHITENCGMLDKLQPGDLVLADRGFLISQQVQLRLAEVKVPAFLKGKKQLDPIDIEDTRKLASVRIHVERVIGMLRQKYKILHNLLPITLLQKNNNKDELAVIDQILTVTCALINLCPPIIN